MSANQDIYFDPFLKKNEGDTAVPSDAQFLCGFVLGLSIDNVPESAYVRHTETHCELWIESEYCRGVAVAVPKTSSVTPSPSVLMDLHFRSIIGYAWPESFEKAGLMTEAEYTAIINTIKAEREAAREAAQKTRTEIIDLAEELGLHPRPTGGGENQWAANCPGTNHHLFIVSSTSSFGCGYCCRKGGPDELRTFVEDRRKRDEERRNQP